MDRLLKKGSIVVLLLVFFSIILVPTTVVHGGKEDIPRTYSIEEPSLIQEPIEMPQGIEDTPRVYSKEGPSFSRLTIFKTMKSLLLLLRLYLPY